MSGRCGTCRHWGRPDDEGQRFRRCQAIIHDERSNSSDDAVGDWLDTADWLDEDEKEPILAIRKHAAVVVDGSGYFAAVRCQEDFGCVLHQAGENK